MIKVARQIILIECFLRYNSRVKNCQVSSYQVKSSEKQKWQNCFRKEQFKRPSEKNQADIDFYLFFNFRAVNFKMTPAFQSLKNHFLGSIFRVFLCNFFSRLQQLTRAGMRSNPPRWQY